MGNTTASAVTVNVDADGDYVFSDANSIFGILQNVSPTKTEMIDIVKTLNGALELTQVMEKTIEFGTQPVSSSESLF